VMRPLYVFVTDSSCDASSSRRRAAASKGTPHIACGTRSEGNAGRKSAIRDYVAKRAEAARVLRTEVERDMPANGIRQRLLARQQQASGK
jgi:hypothetical protein